MAINPRIAYAVAAATAGDTRWVRPPLPWRPSKLRLDVDALRSPVPAVPANGAEGARDAIAWLRGNPPYHMTAADVIDTIERLAREASERSAAPTGSQERRQCAG